MLCREVCNHWSVTIDLLNAREVRVGHIATYMSPVGCLIRSERPRMCEREAGELFVCSAGL